MLHMIFMYTMAAKKSFNSFQIRNCNIKHCIGAICCLLHVDFIYYSKIYDLVSFLPFAIYIGMQALYYMHYDLQ